MLLIFSQDATFISSTFGRFAWLIICVQYLANISGWDLAAEVNSQKSWSLANVDRVLLAGLPRTSSYNIWYTIYNIYTRASQVHAYTYLIWNICTIYKGFPCESSYNIQYKKYSIPGFHTHNSHIIKFHGGIWWFRSCN